MRSRVQLWFPLAGGLIAVLLTACGGSLSGDASLTGDGAQQEAAKPINPQATALIKLASDIEGKGGKKETWLSVYERAAEVSGQAPEVLVKLGDAYMRAGDRPQALKTYNSIVTNSSANAYALLAAGTALVKAGETAQGLPALQKAAASLKSFSAYSRLGVAYTLAGQFKDAKVALEAAQELSSEDLDVTTNLALVQSLSGEHEKAIANMVQVVESDKAHPSHWRNYVLVLSMAGRAEKARKAASGKVPESEMQSLVKRAETIRTLSDPKAQVVALGMAKS